MYLAAAAFVTAATPFEVSASLIASPWKTIYAVARRAGGGVRANSLRFLRLSRSFVALNLAFWVSVKTLRVVLGLALGLALGFLNFGFGFGFGLVAFLAAGLLAAGFLATAGFLAAAVLGAAFFLGEVVVLPVWALGLDTGFAVA